MRGLHSLPGLFLAINDILCMACGASIPDAVYLGERRTSGD